jgi:hypothetical protein
MKYVFRRLLAGVVIVPAVALVYTFICVVLIGLGMPATSNTLATCWQSGLLAGVIFTVGFAVSALAEIRRLND